MTLLSSTSSIRSGYRRHGQDGSHSGPDQRDLVRSEQAPASIAANARNIAAGSMPTWAAKSSPTHRIISGRGRGRLQTPRCRIPQARAEATLFVRKCGVCHAVARHARRRHMGPDLSHLMTRADIAAATLPNTIGNLSGWIADPQHVKPGSLHAPSRHLRSGTVGGPAISSKHCSEATP